MSTKSDTAVYEFECVPGYFIQDNEDAPIIALAPHFGLKEASPGGWKGLTQAIKKLNEEASPEVEYKVVFAQRHGEGYHNVAEALYSTAEWERYWARLNGNGEITWGPDPELTALGEEQARAAYMLWKTELAAGLPVPDRFYCSPLTRSIRTLIISLDGLGDVFKTKKPLIVEDCREEYGVHTCDMRRTKSFLLSTFPGFDIEEGFAEEDPLWKTNERETHAHRQERAGRVLARIFNNDKEALFVSITAHSGWIKGLLGAVNREPYALPTGGLIPMVIKATALGKHLESKQAEHRTA